MHIILSTERLTIRQFTFDDAGFIIELVNTPGWLQFIGDRNIKTTANALKYLLDGPMKSFAQHGFGLAMVELKQDRTPVGMCGLLKRDILDTPDLGFAFLPQYMGLGYAFEAAAATLDHTQNIPGVGSIAAITDPANSASIKLLLKLGFKNSDTIISPNTGTEVLLFRKQV